MLLVKWHPDLNNHIDWGIRFLNLGPKKFYENIFWGVSWPNQPFGTMLLFAGMAFLKNIIFGSIEFLNQTFSFFPSFIIPFIEANIHVWMVKLPFILSDIGLSFLIYKIVNEFKPSAAKLAACLFLFNPVLIYNSTVWGQTDSLINLLAVSGFYLIFKKRFFWGIFLFLSCFLFKLSLIIYLPIFGLLLLKQIKNWSKFIAPIVFFTIFIFCLAIPFAFGAKNPFQWIYYMYTNRVLVRQGSMLNGNAFNFWFLLFGIDFSKSEFIKFGSLTYQAWSRILLAIFLLPVCIKFIRSKLTLTNLFTALLITAFGSFIFLTNMHERYLYPVFPLLTVLLFLPNTKFTIKSLVVLTIIHFINLYNLWFYPLIPVVKNILIFSNFAICRVFSFILIAICLNYLVRYLTSEKV
jgi:Gpi18-like mannosyltransferase